MDHTIGNKIKRLRQKYYKNQADIAEKLGISVPAYSKIETGITDINYSRLLQIADLFQISPACLLPDEDIDMSNLKADRDKLKARVANLQSELLKLQSKLIEVYDENEVLKNKAQLCSCVTT